MTNMKRSFVSAFIGPRDFYQLPLALHEGGMLERLVTDFYMTDLARSLPFMEKLGFFKKISSRHCAGLPSRLVRMNLRTIVEQAVDPRRRRNPRGMAFRMDKALSLDATRIAERTNSDLFLYSGTAYWAFNKLADRKRLLFQFHPHPNFMYRLLAEDVELYPEVRHSFATENDSAPLIDHPPENLIEHALATSILCASTFTKRSLLAQGYPEERVSVAPYGAWPTRERDVRKSKNSRCQFLFVGQGVQRKGLHHLLRAWRAAKLPESDLRLVCWKFDPGLAKLVDQPNVQLSGGLSRSQLDTMFSNSDIFVLPSLIEGFGLVYLEAMAAGLYCIGTQNTGLPDLAAKTDVADVLQSGNIAGLVEALMRAYKRWSRGEIDPEAIRIFSQRRQWLQFRQDVRTFAAR